MVAFGADELLGGLSEMGVSVKQKVMKEFTFKLAVSVYDIEIIRCSKSWQHPACLKVKEFKSSKFKVELVLLSFGLSMDGCSLLFHCSL